MLDIHPAAIENINNKAAPLLKLLKQIPRSKFSEEKFPTEIVTAKISKEEIIGEIEEKIIDYKRNTIGRFCLLNDERFGIVESDYKELRKLAESIQRLPTVRTKLSQEFIEEIIFSWIKLRHSTTSFQTVFSDFLEHEATAAIKSITALIPIANTITEISFEFCGCIVENIPKSMFDECELSLQKFEDPVLRERASAFLSKTRKEYQGYAAITITMKCEPTYAETLSIERAKKITDLLGIFSGAVLVPDIKSTSKIKGTENLEISNAFLLGDTGFQLRQKVLDQGSGRSWSISKDDLNCYKKIGLDTLSDLVTKKNLTEFEITALNMAYLYSKAAFTSDPMAKLVYMLSALESTLLRNENEPIQQNLAERMAIFIGSTLEERKLIVRNVKAVYGLRSRYLHHGHSSQELAELSNFFLNVWLFFGQIIANSGRYKSKIELLDVLDDQKLS